MFQVIKNNKLASTFYLIFVFPLVFFSIEKLITLDGEWLTNNGGVGCQSYPCIRLNNIENMKTINTILCFLFFFLLLLVFERERWFIFGERIYIERKKEFLLLWVSKLRCFVFFCFLLFRLNKIEIKSTS